jgi:hypothetical protein
MKSINICQDIMWAAANMEQDAGERQWQAERGSCCVTDLLSFSAVVSHAAVIISMKGPSLWQEAIGYEVHRLNFTPPSL